MCLSTPKPVMLPPPAPVVAEPDEPQVLRNPEDFRTEVVGNKAAKSRRQLKIELSGAASHTGGLNIPR